MAAEGIRLRANVTIEERDASGRLVGRIQRHNLVVNAGMDLVRDLLYGDYAAGFPGLAYIGLGTGTTPAALTDTDLETPIARYAVTSVTKGTHSLRIVYNLASGTANGNNISEAGLFVASSGGPMYARVVHDAYAKTVAVTKTYTWDIFLTGAV